jgi:hypothetical protein
VTKDAWLGEDAELVKAAGHLRDDGDGRFELTARLGR